ncbi:SusE domain-containing protein [Tenacibaculum amylolyticum]|uniref:SusE domain-containing protein n=1 Tax=Tenacibaculum amylolyticum TaxID=104269 RepID=UPI0038933534
MKKIVNIFLVILTLFVGIGCDDNSETFVVSNSPTAAVLQDLSITNIQLDPVNTTIPALTLSWESADYGLQASVIYNIEFSSDEAFTNPVIASTVTGENSITFSMAELNSAAGNAGLNPFVWANLYARVVSSLGTQNGIPVNSNTVSMNVFPYFNYVFEDYFLVGNATAPNWDNNNNNPPLFRNPNDENLYTYTGRFLNDNPADAGVGRFKVLETLGLWQPQWGTTYPDGSDPIETSGKIAGNPGTQSDDPGRFGVTQTGFYTFTINFATNDYSIVPFDATGIISPATLSVQGSSVAATTALTALTFDEHIWYANSVRLTPGSLQFVTDGGNTWGSDTAFSGSATQGSVMIPVIVEDDYDIWFNDLTGQYILIPLNL